MASFAYWAASVSDVVEEKLGFKNVTTEVFEDHAVWTSRVNRGVARPDDDGRNVTVVFDVGAGHRYAIGGNPADAGAEVVGRLLGMTS